MESKIKHLEFIQAIITRMAGNSFLLKGWSVTLVSALFVLSDKQRNPRFIWVALFPVIMFWFLDAYFLNRERAFRKIYNFVREAESDLKFEINSKPYLENSKEYVSSFCSNTLLLFYGTIIVCIFLIYFLV